MDPCAILGVGADASKAEVMTAVARAMRERRYSAREIAVAQKTLLNRELRAENLLDTVDFTRVLTDAMAAVPPPPECSEAPLLQPLDPEAL